MFIRAVVAILAIDTLAAVHFFLHKFNSSAKLLLLLLIMTPTMAAMCETDGDDVGYNENDEENGDGDC